MSKVEVLVATMHQKDLSKYYEMNIQTDVIFANQADKYEYIEQVIDNHKVRMITTPQRGLSRNRNIALDLAEGEICIFADDDLVYLEGYEGIVLDAFSKLPDADIILFNIDYNGKEINNVNKVEKLSRTRFSNSVRIAIRLKSLEKANIKFNASFGAGAIYSSGEESLFLKECKDKGFIIYKYPGKILSLRECRDSTWFKGYDNKYFYDKGAWLQVAFPKLKHFFKYYYVFKLYKKANIGVPEIIRQINLGAQGYKEGLSYQGQAEE